MAKPPIIIPMASGSAPIVYDAYDKWSGIAKAAFITAQQLATQLTNIDLKPIAFNATFDPQIALAPFPTMAKPAPAGDLSFHAPAVPGEPPTITVPTLPPLEYVSDLLGTLKDAIGTLLGGNCLPPAVAAAIRSRAYSEVFAEEQRAVDNAFAEFASRGFDEPSGVLNRRITEARNEALAKRSVINRDVFIQEQTVAIENLRFAVTAGVNLEGMTVTVFRAEADVQLETVRVASETNRLLIDGWRAKIQLYDAQLRGEVARMDAVLKEFEAGVEVYKADAQVATAAGEYDNRRFALNLSQEQAIVQTEMKRADQDFEQLKYITSVMLEIKKTLSAVSTQLAAAAMSAVNVGASLSSSDNQSIGYSLGVNYSGSMDDQPI